MRFRLLGPLRVWDGTAWAPVRAAQQRLVLAVLLIEAGQVVSADRLVDEVWGEQPPRAALSVLRGYVMRLRRQLGHPDSPLVTHGRGYELALGEEDLDARVFDRLAGAGRRALVAGELAGAASRLSAALALWHGPALADVPESRTVTGHRAWLEQCRLAVTEDWLGGELARGHHSEVVGELARLVAEHPLQEKLWAHLMLALYRCGRRGEALDAYRSARTVLTTELGLEPGQPLRDLHRAILSDDPGLTEPGQAGFGAGRAERLVPSQLPADLAGFAGRDDYLQRLDGLLPAPDRRRSTAVVISAIDGTAGIGKTTLAVHWAHRVAHRFPDGQLYVNLRGFGTGAAAGPDADPDRPGSNGDRNGATPGTNGGHRPSAGANGATAAPAAADSPGPAMGAAEAIRGFLDVLQVPAQRIPASLTAQVGLYRSLLAGRRMLIVLDNARDSEQVRPLLPGSPGCLVLVTSRNQLTGLVAADGAHPLTVDLLSGVEARELLARRLGAGRLAAEPAAVDEIVGRCAGLPLALAIVAARAAVRPGVGLAALAGELRSGLDGLAGGDGSADVRAVFSWSYRALSAGPQRLFRQLSIHHGPELGVPAAASLAGIPIRRAATLLAELARAHLIHQPAADRYAFHDLLRAYATELAARTDGEADRRDALHRLLDHYLHTGHLAARLLEPHRHPLPLDPPRPGVTVEQLTDYQQALAWLGTEHRGMLAAAGQAADAGFDRHAWQLPWSMATFLDLGGHWRELVAAQTIAVPATIRLGDSKAQIRALYGLAAACASLGRFDDAHTHLDQALALAETLDDHIYQAHTLGNRGSLLEKQHRNREAIAVYQRALVLYRDSGNRNGQARALNSIGWCHARLGEYAEALDYCQQALELSLALDDRHLLGSVWDSLGLAHDKLGDHREAADCYDRALALHRDNGDRYFEAETLTHVGDNRGTLGNLTAARAAWQQALVIFEDLGHPDADGVRRRLRL